MKTNSLKLLLLLLMISALAVFAVGCSSSDDTESDEPAAEEAVSEPAAEEEMAEEEAAAEEPAAEEAEEAVDKSDQSYYEVNALTNLPYFIDHQVGLYFAGEALGVETSHVGPVEYDMTAMVNTMEQTMATDPHGINIVGFDPALEPSINAAVAQGIPVVTLDAEVYGSDRLTFLGTGNYNAGRVGAELLAEAIGGEGKVALITKIGQSNLEERIQGYKDEFEENWPDIEMVQVIDDQSDSAKAADGLKAVLQREP